MAPSKADWSLSLAIAARVVLVGEPVVVDRAAKVVYVRLETLLGLDASGGSFNLRPALLGLENHEVDPPLANGDTIPIIGDEEMVGLAGGLVVGARCVEDTVSINVKGDIDNTTGRGIFELVEGD